MIDYSRISGRFGLYYYEIFQVSLMKCNLFNVLFTIHIKSFSIKHCNIISVLENVKLIRTYLLPVDINSFRYLCQSVNLMLNEYTSKLFHKFESLIMLKHSCVVCDVQQFQPYISGILQSAI